jgi:hypothetical protein
MTMSTISVSDLKKKPAKKCLKPAGKDDLVITLEGQPVAVLLLHRGGFGGIHPRARAERAGIAGAGQSSKGRRCRRSSRALHWLKTMAIAVLVD